MAAGCLLSATAALPCPNTCTPASPCRPLKYNVALPPAILSR